MVGKAAVGDKSREEVGQDDLEVMQQRSRRSRVYLRPLDSDLIVFENPAKGFEYPAPTCDDMSWDLAASDMEC